MNTRSGPLVAGALAALILSGCAGAPAGDDASRQTSPAGSGVAVAPGGAAAVTADKQRQAQQLAEEAEKIMLDPDLPPRDKYPKALGMFRDALKIDPGNALATQSITLIEDIYKSMGRPVPETT
jgi:hypothetical protein